MAFEAVPLDGTALTAQQLAHNKRATWLWLMTVPVAALVLAGTGAVAAGVEVALGFLAVVGVMGLTREESVFRWLQTQEMDSSRSKVVLKWCDSCEPVRKYVGQVHAQPRKLTEVDCLVLQDLHKDWVRKQADEEEQAAVKKLQAVR